LEILAITLVASYTGVHFLGNALTFMMVYVWGRRNRGCQNELSWCFTFHAPYLPYVMLGFSVLLGNPWLPHRFDRYLCGSHLFFWNMCTQCWPMCEDGLSRRLMEPPFFLHWLCGSYEEEQLLHQRVINMHMDRHKQVCSTIKSFHATGIILQHMQFGRRQTPVTTMYFCL
jgi:Derlin-2/3